MSSQTNALIEALLGLIDQKLSAQVNAILHHAKFQRLEASWRCVWLLVNESSNHKTVKIKLLNLSQRELSKALLTGLEFDQSPLFHKIYSNEFGQAGGEPFGLLIGDYQFSHKPDHTRQDSIAMLTEISHIAAAAFVPFIAGIQPEFFGLDEFTEFRVPYSLDNLLKLPEYRRWHNLRTEEDARFLNLILTRFLIREPYSAQGIKTQHRAFEESCLTHQDYCWGNSSYLIAVLAMKCFTDTGWFAQLRGLRCDLKQLSALNQTNSQRTSTQSSLITEYRISDALENHLNGAGLMAIRHHAVLNFLQINDCPSLQQPPKYTRNEASSNAKIASQLHYLLCAARFIHYIKIIMRDKIGSFASASDCEHYLYNWLNQYTNSTQNAAAQARYPLSAAKVSITESPNMPGQYACTIHIKPHYQLDHIQSHLKLVTHLKQAA